VGAAAIVLPVSPLPIRAVLFDLDGTLVDNMPFHIDAWIETARALGREITAATVMRDFAGRRNEEILPALLGRAMSPAEIAPLADAKEARYRELFGPHVAPVRGTLALLDELDAHGVVCGIASAAPKPNRDFVLDRLGLRERFRVIVGAEEVARGKPAPDLFLLGASRLGVDPGAVLVFEDAHLGVQAAVAAGMLACGVTTGEPAAVLTAAGAMATAPDLDALPAAIRALWRRGA
jgi:beta-phosphoglucomutase